MKKLLSFVLSSLFLLTALFAHAERIYASAAEAGSISLTAVGLGPDTVYKDSLNRIWLDIVTAEDVEVNDADMRSSQTTCFPTISINGEDFTFSQTTIPSYLASFAQVYTGGRMHILLKRDAGKGEGNASFYPENYPGIPEGDSVIRFYKGTVVGAYVFANDFEVRISASGEFVFLSDPHELTVVNGKATGNVYEIDGKTVASAKSVVTLEAEQRAGYRVSDVIVSGENGEVLADVKFEDNGDGTYSLTMPAENTTVEFIYEEAAYTLRIGEEEIQVFPGKAIGVLPEGRYAVDGYEISDDSTWVWYEDKTAVCLEESEEIYTVTFLDGERTLSVQNYSLSNRNVRIPKIYSDSPYYTVEWEAFTLDGGDKVVRAVWTPVEFTAVFMADGNIVDSFTFTIEDDFLQCPAVPYKAGYRIVGWDIAEFPAEDTIIHAIYEEIA